MTRSVGKANASSSRIKSSAERFVRSNVVKSLRRNWRCNRPWRAISERKESGNDDQVACLHQRRERDADTYEIDETVAPGMHHQ